MILAAWSRNPATPGPESGEFHSCTCTTTLFPFLISPPGCFGPVCELIDEAVAEVRGAFRTLVAHNENAWKKRSWYHQHITDARAVVSRFLQRHRIRGLGSFL